MNKLESTKQEAQARVIQVFMALGDDERVLEAGIYPDEGQWTWWATVASKKYHGEVHYKREAWKASAECRVALVKFLLDGRYIEA